MADSPLNFDYTAFSKAIATAVSLGYARAIATEFEIAPSTVEQWARRTIWPHPLVARRIQEYAVQLVVAGNG